MTHVEFQSRQGHGIEDGNGTTRLDVESHTFVLLMFSRVPLPLTYFIGFCVLRDSNVHSRRELASKTPNGTLDDLHEDGSRLYRYMCDIHILLFVSRFLNFLNLS